METWRTFIALELPNELKMRLARMQKNFMQKTAGVKWVRPEHVHLTLKFLGPTTMDQVDRACTVLEALERETASFPFDVEGVGAFPNSRNPKVIWAGVRVSESLRSLHGKLEAALADAGFAREERSFAPHLTLGRLRDGHARKDIAGLIEVHAAERFGRFDAERVVFFKSDLRPTGPVYREIKDITLMKKA